MIVTEPQYVELQTSSGPMRTHVVRPVSPGRYPAILYYSEIFQITAPIRRTAAMIAGHGYVVLMPEVYHEFEPAGTVLAYDQAGSDRGNQWKYEKELASYDADTRALIAHVKQRDDCTGAVGALGICLGGHLSFRAAMEPEVQGTVCFYGTDIAQGSLGKGKQDDSLARAAAIQGELLMIWGRQDPHIPLESRRKILSRLDEINVKFSWLEVNGAHAFMRDEGPRYDPELALLLYRDTLDFFHRTLR